MWTYSNGAIASMCFGWWKGNSTASLAYQNAGNWVGVCFAVQAIGSMLWALLIPVLEKRLGNKWAYAISLLVGAFGFISTVGIAWIPDITSDQYQYVLLISYALIGAAWAAMLALPFTIVTNAISGSKYMGTLLGLFNCTICLPQIIAALVGGLILDLWEGFQEGMLITSGILLILGAISVVLIKEGKK